MKIEGIPDGWELVKVGKPLVGEYYIDVTGNLYKALDTTPTVLHWHVPIIRKIEKPRQYRPFASAAEFEPHRDRWIRRIHEGELGAKGCFRVSGYDDLGIFNLTKHESYDLMFDDGRQFDDGTPFGIEVKYDDEET